MIPVFFGPGQFASLTIGMWTGGHFLRRIVLATVNVQELLAPCYGYSALMFRVVFPRCGVRGKLSYSFETSTNSEKVGFWNSFIIF